MRHALLWVTAGLALVLFAVGCGSTSSNFGDGGADGGDLDSTFAPDNPFGQTDGGPGEGGCVNLQCQQTCSTTSISGYVYDPKGTVPLYNVYVYVPNAPLDPIPTGVTCTQCQAPASGSPVVSATTDETGHFSIPNAPDGDNIPLVMQLGKWRREITLPHVSKCQDNRYNTKTNPKDTTVESLMRMPKKQKEGSPNDNIPQIAVTTGSCDYTECFLLNTVGIDTSEFAKGGRVNIYDGSGGETSYPYSYGSAVTNLYDKLSTLMTYDIVLNSCECGTEDRGTGYGNVESYLNSGGRFFGTHYMYNFFASASECALGFYPDPTCKGPSDFNGVAQWVGDSGGKYTSAPFLIDQSFPKGASLAKWVNNIEGGTLGQLNLYETRYDVNLVTTGKATRWIYTDTPGGNASSAYSTLYLSFNTPTTQPVQNQCGRAVFSDVHVAGTSSGFCQNPSPSYQPNLDALEFLFFDLSSCVQNDSQPPVPPPH